MSAVDLKARLDLLGTLGSLIVGTLPPSPDVIGAIHEYGGAPPSGKFGVVGVGFETPALQVIFRGVAQDYNGPMAKARIAFLYLMGIQPGQWSVNGIEYLMVRPQQSPASLGKDANNRYEISCNYYITKEYF